MPTEALPFMLPSWLAHETFPPSKVRFSASGRETFPLCGLDSASGVETFPGDDPEFHPARVETFHADEPEERVGDVPLDFEPERACGWGGASGQQRRPSRPCCWRKRQFGSDSRWRVAMGHGGARYGAGRPAMHATVESCRRIDVRAFAREGLLTPGNSFAWMWWQDLQECRVEVEGAALVLRHSLALVPTAQRVPLLRTPCPFGGTRPFFGCPWCGRRVLVLFLRPNKGVSCRRCGGLAYTSTREDEIARNARARNKAAALLAPGGQRPKSMRHSKYGAIVERMHAAERRCIDAMTATIARMSTGLERFPP